MTGVSQRSQDASIQTIGQLERSLGQRMQSLHRELFRESLRNVVCHCFRNYVVVIMYDARLSIEDALLQWGEMESAQSVRQAVDQHMREPWRALISEVLQVPASIMMVDTDSDTGVTGIIAVLEHPLNVRRSYRSKADE